MNYQPLKNIIAFTVSAIYTIALQTVIFIIMTNNFFAVTYDGYELTIAKIIQLSIIILTLTFFPILTGFSLYQYLEDKLD